jgi:dihydrofolate reductase
MKKKRKIIVYIATSADGYIARPDGDMAWLTKRPAPKGFYGWEAFTRSIEAKIMGRKTFDLSVSMGAPFRADDVHYVFSRRPAPSSVPAGVQFITEPIGAFAKRLRNSKGKNVFMMGGGDLIASFLDAGEIDEFIINVIPTFIGEGIPLIARRHFEVPLLLRRVKPFRDGVVQLHYVVQKQSDSDAIRGGRRRR